MSRREFLQLAHVLDLTKHKIGGFYMSQKLDGTRCLWDGGITRGIPTQLVPWASIIDPKTGLKKKKIKQVATGLWSRYGNPIIAPDWFLNSLPACFLDGELWAGVGKFQLCRSICGGDEPDSRFDQIQYAIYSAPNFESLFQNGEIKNSNMHCVIDQKQIRDFITKRLEDFEGDFNFCRDLNFHTELIWLNDKIESQNELETQFDIPDGIVPQPCFLLRQEKLVLNEDQARTRFEEYLITIIDQGGEGLVLRDPTAPWLPKRHTGILKYKPYHDAEGKITGFTSGRETNKGSRLLGKIGALIIDYKGKRLELAGLTDLEREFDTLQGRHFAMEHPGVDMPYWVDGKCFKTDQIVTFKYRELSDDGLPKEARFSRTWSEE
jgi:hypothetical protein